MLRGCEVTIISLTVLGKGKSPSPRARAIEAAVDSTAPLKRKALPGSRHTSPSDLLGAPRPGAHHAGGGSAHSWVISDRTSANI